MSDKKPIRTVIPMRMVALGTVAAVLSVPAQAAAIHGTAHTAFQPGPDLIRVAGEGGEAGSAAIKAPSAGGEADEGGGAVTEADFLAALGFIEGHLRAGLALYQTKDLAAAKTHMGHPIKEKFGAVEHQLNERGFARLKNEIKALADAAEAEAPLTEIESRFATVHATLDSVRVASPGGQVAALKSLALLTRIAADEYKEAVEGGTVSNLHEYQDSWGFLRNVEVEATRVAASDNANIVAAANKILALMQGLGVAYGDIQGMGQMQMEPELLYGAAARMELAAIKVR
ncbi:hypothetical protein ABIE69_002483 [Rhodobacteraceae bacterium MBR-64]